MGDSEVTRGAGELRLVLASASPRRADLLRAAGLDFDIVTPDVDERVHANESPSDYVQRLAAEKSAAALELIRARGDSRAREAQLVVLGADTTVVAAHVILGKPRDDDEVAAVLRTLSGRWHEVVTGLNLRAGELELGGVETTRVAFASLSASDIDWYVRSGEGRDKAGAYAIQGLASRFIPRIEGSYSNVVGLPVATVVGLLSEIRRRLGDGAGNGRTVS